MKEGSPPLLATAIWMMATRVGPLLLGWIAVATLSAQDYGIFVLAFAWINATVGICLGLFPPLVARANADLGPGSDAIARMIHTGVPIVAGLALIIAALVLVRDFGSQSGFQLGLATGWASLAVGCSSLLAIVSWSLGHAKPLVGLALVESVMQATFLGVCVKLSWDISLFLLGFGLISAAISYGFLLTLAQGNRIDLSALFRTEQTAKTASLSAMLGPSLVNTLAMSVTPALAITIAAARGPHLSMDVVFGLAMLWLSAGLFPLQVLTLNQSQKLVQLRTASQAAKAVVLNTAEWALLALATLWGLLLVILILVIGPGLIELAKTKFGPLATYLGYLAWIALGWACLSAVGPVLQAQHRFQVWTAINLAGCIALLFYAAFGALSPAILLIGTSISVMIRCVCAAASLSTKVKRNSQAES